MIATGSVLFPVQTDIKSEQAAQGISEGLEGAALQSVTAEMKLQLPLLCAKAHKGS